MDENGHVYVLMNPSMSKLVKIGKTTRNPEERAKELSSTTGVPTPFIVVYDAYFEDCSKAEKHVHSLLEKEGFRVSANREFFEIPIKTAVDAVMKAKEHFGKFSTQTISVVSEILEPSEESCKDVLELADNLFHGYKDVIINQKKALEYYLQAIQLGSIRAYRMVGRIYGGPIHTGHSFNVETNRKKAIEYFEKGIKKGDVNCYAELACFYDMDDFDDAMENWSIYLQLTPSIEPYYAWKYLLLASIEGFELEGLNKLSAIKDKIINILNTTYRDYWDHYDVLLFIEKKLKNPSKYNLINKMHTSSGDEKPIDVRI